MHVLLDALEPGALSMYEFDQEGSYYYGWQDPAWNIMPVGRRTLISSDLDEPLTRLVDELPSRLSIIRPGFLTAEGDADLVWNEGDETALESDGTLILVLRGCHQWDNFDGWVNRDGSPFEDRHGVLVMGGLAFCPSLREGQDLGDTPVEYFVEQACLGSAGMEHDQQIPSLREAMARSARIHRETEEKRIAARNRATALLLRHLSEEQAQEFGTKRRFHVRGLDGHLYRILDKACHNVFRVEDGLCTVEYCIVTETHVPEHDLMLMQKFLLETDPGHFHEKANSWTVTDDGQRTRRVTDVIADIEPRVEREPAGPRMQALMDALRRDQ